MPAAGGKRVDKKSSAQRGDKKRQFLDCARHLFAEFGYASVSLEQIAEKSGVSRAVLTRSFKNKAVCLEAIGMAWLESLFPADEVVDHSPINVVNQLLSFSDRFLCSLREDPETARIILTGLAEEIEDEERIILQAVLQAVIERLLPVILDGQQSGVIRRDIDPRQTAGDWLRFFLGAALLPLAEPKAGDVPTIMVETLLHGVVKTDV